MKHTTTGAKILLDVLAIMMPNTSKSKLRKMLTEGRIHVDGTTIHKARSQVEKGSVVEILSKKNAFEATPPPPSKKKSTSIYCGKMMPS
jgi:23S rRNA-/tRNA-specific pseudouridylate synthase